MKNNSVTFRSTVRLVLLLTFMGPALLLLAILFGGELLDGLMGGQKTNTKFQDALIGFGYLFTVGGPMAGFGIALYRAFRFSNSDKRYGYLVLITLIPAVLLLGLLYR